MPAEKGVDNIGDKYRMQKQIVASLALVSGKDERGMSRKTLSTVRHTYEDLHFRCHSPRVSSRFQSRVSSSVAVLSVSFEEYKNIHSWSCELTSSSQENRKTVLYIPFLILSKHFPYAHKRKQKRDVKKGT